MRVKNPLGIIGALKMNQALTEREDSGFDVVPMRFRSKG